MRIVAWVYLVWSALAAFGGPFLIAKERGTVEASEYVLALVRIGLGLALAGRVLGWW